MVEWDGVKEAKRAVGWVTKEFVEVHDDVVFILVMVMVSQVHTYLKNLSNCVLPIYVCQFYLRKT